MAADQEAAFTELYNRYWDKLFVIAAHTLNDSYEAEEAVHDVFLNLWKLRTALRLEKPLSHYLAAAIKYTVLNRLARQSRQKSRTGPMNLAVGGHADSTWQQLREKELMAELEKTILGLPEKCRIVFRLSREAGYSTKQIAKELDISVNTVDSHLARALRTMRERFEKLLFFLFF